MTPNWLDPVRCRLWTTAAKTLGLGAAIAWLPHQALAQAPGYYPPQQAVYAQPYGGYPQPFVQQAAYPNRLPIVGHGTQRSAPPAYCPPGSTQPGYSPSMQPWQMPSGGMPMQPGEPGTFPPGSTSPGTMQPGTASPTTPGAPSTQQPSAQQNQQNTGSQQPDISSLSEPPIGSVASLSPGANTPMLGRNDQSNRLNLFDNMSAAPRSRIWGGFQFANTFDTALAPTKELQTFLALHPSYDLDTILLLNEGVTSAFFKNNQTLTRAGAEWAYSDVFSIAVQGQYVATTEVDDSPDTWTNPQIMLKRVLHQDDDTVFSFTFGITPEISNPGHEINERTTKIWPGFLFYEELGAGLFSQGGVQVGLPVKDNEVSTLDWSLSLGYWLYKAPACDRRRGGGRHAHFLSDLHITGVVPQVNVLGKHVLGSPTIVGPFGFQSSASIITVDVVDHSFSIVDPLACDCTNAPVYTVAMPVTTVFPLPNGFIIYNEPRDIIDISVGGQVLFGDSIQVGVGYSLPLTSGEVRQSELITSLTYVF